MRSAGTYRAAKRNAARGHAWLDLRTERRKVGLSRKNWDRLQALKVKSPVEYGLMLSFLHTKINLEGNYVRYNLWRFARS
jgi:hypothetical protein